MARSGDKVVLGFVHTTEVSAYFTVSLLGAALHEMSALGSNRISGIENRVSSANISHERNNIVRAFLAGHSAAWLLMLDADMHFPPESVERILRHAHEDKAPIVGGLCFGVRDGLLFPTLYDLAEVDGRTVTVRRDAYPDDQLVQVTATGAAFLLIHRSVLEAIRDKGFNQTFPWFQETEMSGQPCGEDFTFCLRAGMCGFPVHVDTGVRIGHHKSQILTHDVYQAQQEARHA